MQTETRTKTSSATKTALAIAIGAAAAFAAISLNDAWKNNSPLSQLPLKGGPIYTREMCQTDCSQALDLCVAKTGGSDTCTKQYFSCFDGCSLYPPAKSLPGYMAPGYVPPGYIPSGYTPGGYRPPGYVPPGYEIPGKKPDVTITPGYIPPVNKREPFWKADNNPPDPKALNQQNTFVAPEPAPVYKK